MSRSELRRAVAALAASLVVALWDCCAAVVAQSPDTRAKGLTVDRFDELYRLIKPGTEESKWENVPWMPSTDIWSARQKAAALGKPVFLWYMAGDPLGAC